MMDGMGPGEATRRGGKGILGARLLRVECIIGKLKSYSLEAEKEALGWHMATERHSDDGMLLGNFSWSRLRGVICYNHGGVYVEARARSLCKVKGHLAEPRSRCGGGCHHAFVRLRRYFKIQTVPLEARFSAGLSCSDISMFCVRGG